MERDKMNIPSMMQEIEIYKFNDKHFINIIYRKQKVELCIEDIKISDFAKTLLCDWIDDGLKEIKK